MSPIFKNKNVLGFAFFEGRPFAIGVEPSGSRPAEYLVIGFGYVPFGDGAQSQPDLFRPVCPLTVQGAAAVTAENPLFIRAGKVGFQRLGAADQIEALGVDCRIGDEGRSLGPLALAAMTDRHLIDRFSVFIGDFAAETVSFDHLIHLSCARGFY